MKAIKNVETNAVVIVREDTSVMIEELKALGIKFGKTSLSELLSGKREVVNGFKLVEVEETPAGDDAGGEDGAGADSSAAGDSQGQADNQGSDDQQDNGGQQDNQGGNDDAPVPGNQGGTSEQHAAAGAQSHKNDGDNQGGDDRAQQGNQGGNQGGQGGGNNGGGRQRKVIKNADPKGKIKPVRKGTKIAQGLEMLQKGCTEKELEDAEMSDDLVDFVNRRVVKRGYGIKVDGDKITLVIPNGTDGIQYTAAGGNGGGDDEGDQGGAQGGGNQGGQQGGDDSQSTPADGE